MVRAGHEGEQPETEAGLEQARPRDETSRRGRHLRRQAQLRVARKFAAEPDPERVMHALLVEAEALVGGYPRDGRSMG